MHGCDFDSNLTQYGIRVSASRAPHGIERNFQARFLDDIKIDNFAQGKPAEIRDHPKVQEVYFGSGKTFEDKKVSA